MKTLRIHIKGNFQDGYLYGGQLFLIENEGSVKSVCLWEILALNLIPNTDEYHFFKLVFTQNNWIVNDQAKSYLGISTFKKSFNRLWSRFSRVEYSFDVDPKKSIHLSTIESTPVFDFKLYGMRMYIGNRNGLYEAPISIKNLRDVSLNRNVERVFDARTTQISAKSGSVMLSSNTDGLFHGQILDYESKLAVKERAIADKSLRTNWSGYDLVNYEQQNHFSYLKSEYTKVENRQVLYSLDDESSKKISIDKIGETSLSQEVMLENIKLDVDKVIYSFNSSTACYFILSDGRFFRTYFHKDSRLEDVKLSTAVTKLPNTEKRHGSALKPISVKLIPKGCIIEYFDKVVLVHNDSKIILENKAVTAIKTFPASLRYKNIIAIFDGEGVSIHTIYPFG